MPVAFSKSQSSVSNLAAYPAGESGCSPLRWTRPTRSVGGGGECRFVSAQYSFQLRPVTSL